MTRWHCNAATWMSWGANWGRSSSSSFLVFERWTSGPASQKQGLFVQKQALFNV